ncbi:hypothetical protein OOT08_10875, partial [Leucobacter sp. M11]|nr:hypothetical protein [Leucobacter sp. M11]
QPVSGIAQRALAEFMRSGGLQRHLVRVGRAYAHRRGLVLAAAAELGPGRTLGALEGGLHAAITWRGLPDPDRIVASLAERGIDLASLTKYFHGEDPAGRSGLVFGYGAPSDLQLRSALDEITAALNDPTEFPLRAE